MKTLKPLLLLLCASLLFATTMGPSVAASYPDKPVKMMIGYGPGSSTDLVGRLLAQGLSELWKQPVVVENRAGAAGNIAADTVAKSAADGYSLLFAQNGLAISVAAKNNLPFNGQKDLLAVALVAATPHILVVSPSSPAKSTAELIALAKSQPNKLNFGSSGIGNSDHMAGELFKVLAGIEAMHIPYKSGSLAATDVIGGQLDFYFAGMPVGLPLYKGGRLRALAVTSATRYAGAAELPTLKESGIADYEMTLWQGVFLPAGVPKDVTDFIGTSVLKLLDDPTMRDRLTKAGAQITPMNRASFTDLYLGDIARWKIIIPAAKIKLE